jgi:ABC-type oligopeptide transport system substrate-binding subunit
MPPPPAPRALSCLALVLMLLAGCSPSHAPGRVSTFWLAGHPMPTFDPDGPPDALREALERQLSRGLVDVDTTGHVTLALADSLGCTSDSLTWTFHLRSDARFTDGTRVTSAHVRDAMLAGLGRQDHATREWLLAAVRGMPGVRAGRPLPPLGIETAGDRRLVLRLGVRDARLLEKLAVPGVSTPC